MLIVVAFAAGCGKKKGKVKKAEHKKETKSMNMPLAQNTDADKNTSFFDDKVDAFVLEGSDNKMTVASNDLSWVAEADDVLKAFKPVHFEFDRHTVSIDQEPVLKNDVQEALRVAERGEKIMVEGHACHSAGSKSYNLLISEQRAQEVARRLKSEGINESQLQIVGRGAEMPVVLYGDREQQRVNRRVELFTVNA